MTVSSKLRCTLVQFSFNHYFLLYLFKRMPIACLETDLSHGYAQVELKHCIYIDSFQIKSKSSPTYLNETN